MEVEELAARLARQLEGVDGWLHPSEAIVLYAAAQEAVHEDPAAVVVEVGSWLGRSTIALGLGVAEAGGTTPVQAVDSHLLYPESDVPLARVNRLPLLQANLKIAGVADHVLIVQAASVVAGPSYADSSVSVLFLDADHKYEGIATDIRTWTRTLRPNAFVMFNDHWQEGVTQALLELVATKESGFRDPTWIVNSLCFRYRPNAPWTPGDAKALRNVRILLRWGRVFKDLRRRRRLQGAIPQRILARIGESVIAPALNKIVPSALGEASVHDFTMDEGR